MFRSWLDAVKVRTASYVFVPGTGAIGLLFAIPLAL
jgi:L-cysteine desulfidase